ncbi:DoxX family protein [Bacillus sp. FJAT-29814]|uniref:DoxX family protein n=1 Tax=Bacillus sp. FJAT-29814 TaxID=1729688 RepID=UPI0026474DC9|nr:DoxX family protein [Bacillus sp. FJAT-29814]
MSRIQMNRNEIGKVILRVLTFFIAVIELIGGFAIILGLGTRIVTTVFALIMIGAIFTVKLSLGFLGNGQMAGSEHELVLLAVSIYFVFAEKSRMSLDHKFFQS